MSLDKLCFFLDKSRVFVFVFKIMYFFFLQKCGVVKIAPSIPKKKKLLRRCIGVTNPG